MQAKKEDHQNSNSLPGPVEPSHGILTSPESSFETPRSITASNDLSHAQKIVALENWRGIELQVVRADGEGMAPAQSSEQTSADSATRLQSIEQELELLRGSGPS
jgi:hypothetical protein